MALNRRKMLGTALGAGIAGPSMTKDAIAGGMNLLQTVAPPLGGSYGEAKQATPHSLDMIARAKRLAAGDIRDEDRNYPTEGNPCPFAPLKSVSDHARQFMRANRYERQWRERVIASARDALDNFDKTGVLRHFF